VKFIELNEEVFYALVMSYERAADQLDFNSGTKDRSLD
jgi:hypothetical protein